MIAFKKISYSKLLRVDYVSHPMGKIYKHKYEAWEKPEGDTDLLTSYIKDYPGENITFFSKLKFSTSDLLIQAIKLLLC